MEGISQEPLVLYVDQDILKQLVRGQLSDIKLPIPGKEITLHLQGLRIRKHTSPWEGHSPAGDMRIILTSGDDFFSTNGKVIVYRPDPDTERCIGEDRDPECEMSTEDDFLIPAAMDQSYPDAQYDIGSKSEEPWKSTQDDKNFIDKLPIPSNDEDEPFTPDRIEG